jgi:hypothetical protein
MVHLELTEEEATEIANHTAFTAFHAIDDDDEYAWRIGYLAVAILAKLEAAFPAIVNNAQYSCAHEVSLLRKRIAEHAFSRRPS